MTEDVVGEKPRRRWFSTTFKVLFCVLAALILIFAVLANLGGSSETLKRSIEEYVAENTGYDAKVGKLNNMNFFPDIVLDFENTEFFRRDQIDVVMAAQKVQVAFGFWDVMARTGKIKKMNIEGFRALPGTLLEKSVRVDRLAIIETEGGPRMESAGLIGEHAFSVSYSMESSGLGGGKKYSFGNERDLDITFGDASFKGHMKQSDQKDMMLENIEVKLSDKQVATGNIVMARQENRVKIAGDIVMKEHGTDINPDINLHLRTERFGIINVDGALNSTEFHTHDFSAGSAYNDLMTIVESTFGPADESEIIDLELKAGTLYRGEISEGGYQGPLPLKGWRIDVGAIKKAP
jgi:hypothetical protein